MNIGLEQIFFYRRDKKGQQVNENVLNITNIRKMQIKMTMNVHHKKKNKWKGCGEKATFICCWWKYKLVQAQQKTAQRFLNKQTSKKNTAELQYDLEILLLGIYPKDFTSRSKEISVFPHSLAVIHNSKDLEAI